MLRFIPILILLCLVGCKAEIETVTPGRGVASEERGPRAKIYPRGEDARVDRHGVWQGFDDENRRRWEIRYTRGNPAGAYREWAEDGRLLAEWSYNWEGVLDGEARWYDESGEIVRREHILPDNQPEFDPIGEQAKLREWADTL